MDSLDVSFFLPAKNMPSDNCTDKQSGVTRSCRSLFSRCTVLRIQNDIHAPKLNRKVAIPEYTPKIITFRRPVDTNKSSSSDQSVARCSGVNRNCHSSSATCASSSCATVKATIANPSMQTAEILAKAKLAINTAGSFLHAPYSPTTELKMMI